MAFANVIGEILLKVVWPWVVKHVWPLIVKFIIQLIAKGLTKLSAQVSERIQSRMQTRADEADLKAQAAERASGAAQSEGEREKHEAIAKVWRQVAEEFRQDNETLRRQVADLSKAQQSSLNSEVLATEPILDTSGQTPAVTVGTTKGNVPALPMPKTGQL